MTWAPQVTVILGLGWAQLDATSHCFVFPILMQQGMMRINPMACSKFKLYLMSSHNASYELSNPCGCHLAWPISYRCLNCKCNENKPKKKAEEQKRNGSFASGGASQKQVQMSLAAPPHPAPHLHIPPPTLQKPHWKPPLTCSSRSLCCSLAHQKLGHHKEQKAKPKIPRNVYTREACGNELWSCAVQPLIQSQW